MTRYGITGHQGLPEPTRALVREAIASRLQQGDSEVIGVSSLAEGADQVFAEAILDHGGSLIAVIPCAGYERTFNDPQARLTFTRLLNASSQTITLSFQEPSEEAFLAAGREVANLSDVLIAVWDGRPAQGLGGTADVVAYAKAQHRSVEVVWPEGATRG